MKDNAVISPTPLVTSPLVKMVNIHKSYGAVTALNGVDIVIGRNEIVGLIGDNGAGKSTLIKVLTGVEKQDDGQIYWKDEEVKRHTVENSRHMGIETVFQDRALAEKQNIWRNLFMGRELIYGKTGFIRIGESQKEAINVLKKMIGFTQSGLTPNLGVMGLSGGEKQGIAIARALYFDAELIILDEPTNNLSLSETNKVLDFVRWVKEQGKSCIFITHSIYHVYSVADRFVILDRGNTIGEFIKKDLSLDELVEKLEYVAKHGTLN
ncbi:ABC transporter ATP-binding protein [Candidatus Atribacteria bacterium RBG_16_35_8]|nr:MAG: ABC transporter ATP-binding protein [Candidatus Atribacteria bacterium RBG_16_35_8]